MEKFKFVLKIFVVYSTFASAAYAYVDGGTALLLMQGAFAAVGAALAFLKKPWQLIAKIFGRKKNTGA